MEWLILLFSGMGEVTGVLGIEKFLHQRRDFGICLMFGGYSVAIGCLHTVVQILPLPIAYAVFTALGTLGTTALGICFWGDSFRPARLLAIAVIVIGVVGVKLSN